MNELATGGAAAETCSQCSKPLTPDDRVAAGDRAFCRSCYDSLRLELRGALQNMTTDINYAGATVGAVLGGVVGAAAWAGFTILTHLGLGLVAIVIGWLVGHGTVRFAGGKRGPGLQAISVAVSILSYLAASYVVTMTFANRQFAQSGEALRIGFPPASIEQLVAVLSAGFDLMDLVFLAIVIYQAWKIPQAPPLPPALAT